MSRKNPLHACIGVTLGAIYAAVPANADFSGMVLFGDSLSDVGNIFDQTFHLVPQSPPNFNGRFSNGILWDEHFAQDLSLPLPTPSRLGGKDFASGGARTGGGTTLYFPFSIPNVGLQINNYLGSNTPSPSELFVVWGGGNDFINGQTNVSVPVNNMAAHVTALANAGAKQFFVPNLPPLGKIPRFRGTADEAAMDARSAQFNDQLATTLNNLENSLNIQIWQMDIEGIFHDMLADPAAYGFTNITNPALVGSTPAPNQDEYLFWDDIHPTRIGHTILSGFASDLVFTHTWKSTQAAGNWTSAAGWDPAGVPQSDWIAHVVNNNISQPQAVTIDASSSVKHVLVRGDSGRMTLGIPAATTLTAQDVQIAQQGEVEMQGGTLVATTVNVTTGGTLGGSGLVDANVTNSGEVAPGQPGTLMSIDGNYTQTSAGRLAFELGGTGSGQFDRLAITGNATLLAGAIAVQLVGNFIALPGDSFDVMTFASRTGDLNLLNETGFAGLIFSRIFSTTSLTLDVSALGGDANLDGLVNLADYNILAGNFGQPGRNWLTADFTGDGLVNLADYNILAAQFGVAAILEGPTPSDWATLGSLVPEPGLIGFVAGFAPILLARRTRRIVRA